MQEIKKVFNVNISQQYQILMEEVFTSGGRTSIKTVFKKCKYVQWSILAELCVKVSGNGLTGCDGIFLDTFL